MLGFYVRCKVRVEVQGYFFIWIFNYYSTIILKRLSFLPLNYLDTFIEISLTWLYGSTSVPSYLYICLFLNQNHTILIHRGFQQIIGYTRGSMRSSNMFFLKYVCFSRPFTLLYTF